MARRVVITGMGFISPLGNTRQKVREALHAGRSGVTYLEGAAAAMLKFGGAAHDFTGDVADFGPLEKLQKRNIKKGLKLMSRDIQMGVAAAQLALTDAGLALGDCEPTRSGVSFGSDYIMSEPGEFSAAIAACIDDNGVFDYQQWAKNGMPQITPLWLLKYLPNMPASHIAIYNDFRGPSNSITLREASGNLAIGEACCTISRGNAELIIAGASGTRLQLTRSIQVSLQEEIIQQDIAPETASRPFDKDRAGMVLGEGAGALILESLESAEARGATMLAEIIGYGASSVLQSNGVARLEVAMANAMGAALRTAKLAPNDVGHVHAHGLSTQSSDLAEAQAIQRVFGERPTPIPVTAAKSYFGNLGAGSGVIELGSSVEALNSGELFPVLNYETPDPACEIFVAAENGVPAGDVAMNVSVTPQGQASAILVCRPR